MAFLDRRERHHAWAVDADLVTIRRFAISKTAVTFKQHCATGHRRWSHAFFAQYGR
ncbi:MAG TPA: hypothetical protein VES73_05450 [Lamprocystis sp. (in: g-proteobacteria)]|nr:hypothetical protein [Lamprocystis sp. (in: g-proteobacteria)]